MRIAFVGKGGSGKTTMAALFSLYLEKKGASNILSIDADINMHLPEIILGEKFPKEKCLSMPKVSKDVLRYLLGKNERASIETFRKTTPPTSESNLIRLEDKENDLFQKYSIEKSGVNLMAVGTYGSKGIGASCYHNNLSILENFLSHLIDDKGFLVVDMVAGTDAFASSLHAQFDMIVLVVEPTRRSLEVFKQYEELASAAGVSEQVYVIGNKISSDSDRDFLLQNMPKSKILGFFSSSDYVREHDKEGGAIDFDKLDSKDLEVLENILEKTRSNVKDPNERLEKIYALHKRYVAQPFIKDRLGDLTVQIDPSFKF